MNWEQIKDALAELPDSVVTVLSGELRTGGLSDIPDKHKAFGRRKTIATNAWRNPTGAVDRNVQRLVVAYKDLQLGWNIARECKLQNVPIPSTLAWNCEPVFRAWMYQNNPVRYHDPHLLEAISWQTPAMRSTAIKIQACLTARDATIEDVADALKLPEESLRIYDELFYNVTGRKQDALWLSDLVYPDGRVVEFYEDYANRARLDNLLMRAGFRNGLEHVLQLSGISADPSDMLEASVSAQQMEAYLMSQGLLMAQNGWINNTKNASAIYHARHLLTAAKMGGDSSAAGSEYMDLGDTLWQELLEIKRPQSIEALRLQNANRDAIDVAGVEQED